MNDIRLYFMNERFERVGVLIQGAGGLSFTSLEWESVFHKQDGFTLQCSVSDSRDVDFIMDSGTAFIIRNDTMQAAYIERKSFDGKNLELEGIGVEGLLVKRFTIEKDYLPTGANEGTNLAGAVMCDIINDNAPFSWLVAERDQNMVGPSIATFTELTGNVYKYIATLSQAYDIGFKCRYDENINGVRFSAYEVTPHDVDIPGRTYRLSDDLENVKSLEYEKDTSKYYNYARVVGEDMTRIVDQSVDGERYEFSFKSRSKRRTLTDEEYAAILYAEGVQELSKRRIDEVFILQPADNQHVEVGWEAMSISKSINRATMSFCTELKETWEKAYSREYVFGYRMDDKDALIIQLQEGLYV